MRTRFTLVLIVLFLALGKATQPSNTHAAPSQAVQTPVLKWQHSGCHPSWCETGWYSSPAVADLDNNGTMEVIGAAYTLFAFNGEDGSEQWHVGPPASNARTWPGVVVTDIERWPSPTATPSTCRLS